MDGEVTVLSEARMPIRCEDDISLVRRAVRQRTERRGFGVFAIAAVTTATSELTRNAWVHAGGGEALLQEISDGRRIGIRVQLMDRGPGIPDVERALQEGYSTVGSLGLGLAGSRRLVDEMRIESESRRGTTVTVTKWKSR